MANSKAIPFEKYHGAGYDFVVIDNRSGELDSCCGQSQTAIQQLCDRITGVGSNGLLEIKSHPESDFELVYYNPKGQKYMLCGSGCRCAIAYARHLSLFTGKEVTFHADDGCHVGSYESDEKITVKMGDVSEITRYDDQNYFVFTGCPQHVRFTSALDDIDVALEGRAMRHAKYGTVNANFVQLQEDGSLRMRTYDRCVDGEVVSCGTGSVACALALDIKMSSVATSGKTTTRLCAKGGELAVNFERGSPGAYRDIFLIGPAKRAFSGKFYPD